MLFFHNQTNFKNYFFVIDLHKWQCYTVSAIGREAPISIKKEDKNMLFFKKRVEAGSGRDILSRPLYLLDKLSRLRISAITNFQA